MMYTNRVKNMEDIYICYLENKNEPILVSNARVFGAPNLYNNYKSREDLEEKCEDDKDKDISFGESESNLVAKIIINNKIENEAEIVEFINYAYRPKVGTRYRLSFQANKCF